MKLPQSWEVRAANCRKPCFITPFMEAGTLSQPLLPAGQFSRHRPSGRFPVPRDAPRTPLSDSGPRPARGLSTTRAPCPRGKDGLTSRPARAPEPSERLTPAAPSSRLHWSVPHLRTPRRRRAVRGGRGKPGGRQEPGDAAARTQASPLPVASLTPAAGRADAHAG